eukprot:GFUD01002784.1.p1 GENE.GFUD01002784.1~~GFUD01002784.1.p1  ORF type:complete len:650 (+),score=141.30 GFUD01002784.1:424-2373(+)
MVYVYVCKRFKVTMDMVSGKDSEWILNLVKFYLKHRRKEMQKLERAEVNPKKRLNAASYDSASDVFKINIVYKDQKGVDQELKWIIKVTRSDVNDVANVLLKHEKQVFSRLVSDLINTVKQKSAGFLEGARVSPKDLILTPEFIYEETSHAADVSRHVLVLDNLEEKQFFGIPSGALNLPHFKCAVKTVAKIHGVGICHKLMLIQSFAQQEAASQQKKTHEDVEVEGDHTNKVLVGKEGIFSRFPFLNDRLHTMNHLISNRHTFLNMYQQFLKCFPKEDYLMDIFEYIRMSTDDILKLNKEEQKEGEEEKPDCDHPLDSIALGVLEARSFLFFYEEENNKENIKAIPKGTKVQRSHSDRAATRKSYDSQKSIPSNKNETLKNNVNKDMPAKAKCPKIESFNKSFNKSDNKTPVKTNKFQNKFFQNVKKSQDDAIVPPLQLKKREGPANAWAKPLKAALVNAKYVTYERVTNDLAVLFFTCGDTLTRRFYMIKMVEVFAETLGITLSSLGVDTDQFHINWQEFIQEFQTHLLYGFLVGVLVSMANTDVADLNELIKSSSHPDKKEVIGPCSQAGDSDFSNRSVKLTAPRITFLLDMMKDIGSYVESKDFELGLPLTNFGRYQELWSMSDNGEGEEEEDEDEEEEDESEEE